MIIYSIRDEDANCINAYTATLGQQHLEPLRDLLRRRFCEYDRHQMMPTEIVMVDFSGIESTTASYLKALVVPFLTYKEPTMSEKVGRIGGDPDYRQSIYPMVTGLNEEVREELEEVLKFRSLPCLEASRWCDDKVLSAHLLGGMDTILTTTFLLLVREKAASATDLHARYQDEHITITGWNNRLADLHRLRLATRTKQGRQWIYEPTTKEVIYG